jgi:hypothetical protein
MFESDPARTILAPGADGALTGLRVIEISSFVAAPLGGMTLAQLGADVIRIDPIGGAADQARWPRTADGASLYWAGLNKGKRSVTIDFRSQRGQELITALITAPGQDRGILLTNAVGRRFLEHETLRRHRPDLIQVVVSGYRDGSAAVDYTVNAALGFPWLTGPAELAAPVNHVLPAWDIACGLNAAANTPPGTAGTTGPTGPGRAGTPAGTAGPVPRATAPGHVPASPPPRYPAAVTAPTLPAAAGMPAARSDPVPGTPEPGTGAALRAPDEPEPAGPEPADPGPAEPAGPDPEDNDDGGITPKATHRPPITAPQV